MSKTKTVKTRIQNKHDTEANWITAGYNGFIPLAGELIVYDDRYKDKDGKEVVVADAVRYKIGDGINKVTDLPFLSISSDADLKLSEQFTITQDFGYYKLDGAASKKVGTVGQSIHQFLQGAFANEDKTIFGTNPSCSISMSGGSAEIGSTITPSASWSTSAGEYKWGTFSKDKGTADYTDKATGITYDTGDIKIDKPSFVIKGSTTVTASGTATRSAVQQYPCSNLGSDLTNDLAAEYKAEQTLTPTKTATFTCYRNSFYGVLSTKDTLDNLSSSRMRNICENLAKSNKALVNNSSFTISIPKSTEANPVYRVLIAYPATLRNLTSVLDKNDSNSNIVSGFGSPKLLGIDGKDGYTPTDYKVYVLDFANPYDTANTFTVTI